MFVYTPEELRHLEDLRCNYRFFGDTGEDAEYYRHLAECMRYISNRPYADAENGPSADDGCFDAPTPEAYEEIADEIECGMIRGEFI